ncbi:MAG TPA: amino acid adenylation domain-containing protein [Polyangia bacterium]|nr:amino acid adenylation domain-containing protein [Polyangia bacterium]
MGEQSPVPDRASTSDTGGYPLTPMQAGMLFSSLVAPSAGYDIGQVDLTLREHLDAAALAQAWTSVARRHWALSCRVVWDRFDEPRQIPVPGVFVPVEVIDCDGAGPTAIEQQIALFCQQDRLRGFDLAKAPLMRVTLFQAAGAPTRFICTFHYILMDGQSLPMVLTEVFAVYDRIRQGATPSGAPPAGSFGEYVQSLARRDRSAGHAHFRKLLEGRAVPTRLAFAELPDPVTAGGAHAVITRTTTEAQSDAIRALARRTATSVAAVAHAAWALALSRYATETDVLFGTAFSDRSSALDGGAASMVGLMINVLPIRAHCDDERTVAQLLSELEGQLASLRVHGHTPLREIGGHNAGVVGRYSLETLLIVEPEDLGSALERMGGEAWRHRACRLYEQPIVPLAVKVAAGTRISVQVLLDLRHYRQTAVERLVTSFMLALDELARDETRALGAVSVIPPGDLETTRRVWNATNRRFSDQLLVHQLFEAQVGSRGQAVAVEHEGDALSYEQLEERANRVAHALIARGVGPGAYVGICLSRRPSLVAAILGVLKSGAAYVPLDSQYPPARLAAMTESVHATLLVTEQRHAHLFPELPQLLLDDDDSALLKFAETRPAIETTPSEVCCVFFTSGSTGTPNGVMVSHRAMVNTLEWVTREFSVRPGDRLLFVTSPCFDLSVYDILGTLGAGGTVVIANEDLLRSPSALANAVTGRAITIWNSAPAALNRILPFLAPLAAPTLRLVLSSGDRMPTTLPGAIRALFPAAEIVNLGGATEAAIWSNWFRVRDVDLGSPRIPYGWPIQNCRYYILDRALRSVPVGVTGDLYIAGVCLAEGYLNNPELTDRRFLIDPAEPHDRLYRTGDVARYLEDGTLDLIGREDQQIKIRGFRVEIGEVEAALAGMPGITHAICVPYQDSLGDRFLVAYVVPANPATVNAQSIKEFLARHLPDFMIPAQIVFLKELPLSSNGKLDRAALRRDLNRDTDTFVAPRTEQERRVANIWERLLDFRPIGVNDDFFERGGHSLLAVAFVAAAQAELNLAIPLERLMERPTIASLLRQPSRSDRAADSKRFLLFNMHGHRPPLVLLPELRGRIYVYRDLPKSFGTEQPVLLGQPVGGEPEDSDIEPTIERIAEIYAAELNRLVPEGPIIVGGFSFGTTVALELVHRLRQAGRRVPLLVSLDGLAPGYPAALPLPARLLAHLKYAVGAPAATRPLYIADRLASARKILYRALGHEHLLFPENLSAPPETIKRHMRIYRLNMRAISCYRPAFKEPGPFLLLRAERPERWVGIESEEPDHGWRQFVTGAITIETLPGEHLTIMRPSNHRLVAEKISSGIDRLAKF